MPLPRLLAAMLSAVLLAGPAEADFWSELKEAVGIARQQAETESKQKAEGDPASGTLPGESGPAAPGAGHGPAGPGGGKAAGAGGSASNAAGAGNGGGRGKE